MKQLMRNLFLILLIATIELNGSVLYHILSGIEVGYNYKIPFSKPIDDMVTHFNNVEKRKILEGRGVEKLEDYTSSQGYFIRYSIYKYLDKRTDILTSYEVTAELEVNNSTIGSDFDYLLNPDYKCTREYEIEYSSVMLIGGYGMSPYKDLLISANLGLGFDNFRINSKLNAPSSSQFTKQDVLDYENENFTTNTPETRMQNGKFKDYGFSVKAELKSEYFISRRLSASLYGNYKYSYIGEIDDEDGVEFRKNQDSESPIKIDFHEIRVGIGLAYYFVMEW